MTAFEQLTIIDQVEIVRTRALQVRFGIVTLEDGLEPDEDGTRYHRGVIEPGDDPAEFLAAQAAGMAELGYPPHPVNAEAFLHELTSAVHTPELVDAARAERARLIKDGPGPRKERTVRDILKTAGGRLRLAAPDPGGYQHDSIVDQIVITRARAAVVTFGLVTIKGEREVFRRFNRATVKPGADVGALITQARKGLRDRSDPPLTPAAEGIITTVAGAVHTPVRVQLYAQLRDAQLLEVLRKHQESGREGQPRVPPELSKEDALRVALEGGG